MEQPVTYCHILGHFIISKEKELQRAVQNASFGPKKTNNNKKNIFFQESPKPKITKVMKDVPGLQQIASAP